MKHLCLKLEPMIIIYFSLGSQILWKLIKHEVKRENNFPQILAGSRARRLVIIYIHIHRKYTERHINGLSLPPFHHFQLETFNFPMLSPCDPRLRPQCRIVWKGSRLFRWPHHVTITSAGDQMYWHKIHQTDKQCQTYVKHYSFIDI